MSVRLSQPDFQALFFETFGTKPKKVRYRLRLDSNLGHDEVFLSSLVHDARFLRSEISLRGDKLLLKLERDCWELGMSQGENGDTLDLHHSLAVLRVSPVREVIWTLSHERLEASQELCIGELYRNRDESGSLDSFVIAGLDWRASILLREDIPPRLELEDKTVPALWSKISSDPKLASRFRGGEG